MVKYARQGELPTGNSVACQQRCQDFQRIGENIGDGNIGDKIERNVGGGKRNLRIILRGVLCCVLCCVLCRVLCGVIARRINCLRININTDRG